jgi:secreted PhoX family phosphatase
MLTRRNFGLGLVSGAFGGLALSGCAGISAGDLLSRIPKYGHRPMRRVAGHGSLCDDPDGLFDLPHGFRYEIISRFGDSMDDGHQVPDAADGMGSFAIDDRKMVLVRNHELSPGELAKGPLGRARPPRTLAGAYDSGPGGALPGGTTTIVYDYRNGVVESQRLSLAGTVRNCAGGAAPWGSWLSCEEDFSHAFGKRHGFVFDVPALHPGLVEPTPLTHLGRFKHEAVAIDPATGTAYLTEDQVDALFYRYVPPSDGDARNAGGLLQALAFAKAGAGTDARNWHGDWTIGEWREVAWKTLPAQSGDPDRPSPRDDLRKRGRRDVGAACFANGEGIHLDPNTREIFFTCTSGGRIKSGQIFRYRPPPLDAGGHEPEEGGALQLFIEATDTRRFNYGDNLVVAPNGHLIVCEDPYFGGERNYLLRPIVEKLGVAPPCYLRGVTPEGEVYDVARLNGGSELAGVCFSPNGGTLFVNVYSRAKTLAVRGDWGSPRPGWGLYRADGSGVWPAA